MGKPNDQLMVIVDADTLAGWRRATSSLAQLHDAVDALRTQAPDAVIAVIADASLKWALSESERDEIELDIVTGALLFAPAGCVDGHVGFIGRVVEKATRQGMDVVAITDQAVRPLPTGQGAQGPGRALGLRSRGCGRAHPRRRGAPPSRHPAPPAAPQLSSVGQLLKSRIGDSGGMLNPGPGRQPAAPRSSSTWVMLSRSSS